MPSWHNNRLYNLGLQLTLLRLEIRDFQIHSYGVISVQFSMINKNGNVYGMCQQHNGYLCCWKLHLVSPLLQNK